MDARGIRRGQCLIDGCDCDQYIPPADENIFKCEYCGDPPAKHKKVPDSVSPPSQSQSAPKEKECESPAVEKVRPKWERPDLGWIPNPSRKTGIYYNSVLPVFYKSYWTICPHPKQFRKAFIVERERQYQVDAGIERVEKTFTFLKGDNPAAGNRFFVGYVPKSTDLGAINTLETKFNDVITDIREIKDKVLQQDESLFCYGGKKLQSGRMCAHAFNEQKKQQLDVLEREVKETQSKLEEAKVKYNNIWKFSEKRQQQKSDITKIRNNNLKTKLRKQRATAKQCMQLYVSLGGMTDDYDICNNGAIQITDLTTECFENVVITKQDRDTVKYLRRSGCFRGDALDIVNDNISDTESDSESDNDI